MKKNIFAVFKGLIFTYILCLVICFINWLNMPKYWIGNSQWPTTASYSQFYKMKKNSVDVLFFGSSVCVNNFNPQEIYNDYGIRSYNLGSEQQSIFLSYYWLKEALRSQKPKAVVLETKFLFTIHPEDAINTVEGLTRKCIDPMSPLSPVKLEVARDYCNRDLNEPFLSFYLTNIRFHTRWKSLGEEDFSPSYTSNAHLKGFSQLLYLPGGEYKPFIPTDKMTITDFDPLMKEYLDKMKSLCDENDIKFILVTVPTGMSDGMNNALNSYASEHGINYYNFAYWKNYDKLDIDPSTETSVDHANVLGAVKSSRLIGQILKDDYQIEGHEDSQWNSTKEYYSKILKKAALMTTNNVEDYVALLKDDDYTVFISAMDDASSGLTEKTRKELAELGLQVDLSGHFRDSYCTVIDRGNVIEEEISHDVVTHQGSIRNRRVMYTITSRGYDCGSSSSIVISGAENSKQQRGLNIVVYDNVLQKVIDSVNFDTCASYEEQAARR